MSHAWPTLQYMSVFTSVQRLDNRILLWSLKHRDRQAVIRMVRLVSTSGDGYAQAATIVLLAIFDQQAVAYAFTVLLLVERSIYWLLKNTLKRPRPHEQFPSFQSVIEASDRFSFPSGHTSAAFLLAATLSPVLLTTSAFWLAPLLFVWATGVAASRVLLGVHYPTDTVAGAALGLSVAAAGL